MMSTAVLLCVFEKESWVKQSEDIQEKFKFKTAAYAKKKKKDTVKSTKQYQYEMGNTNSTSTHQDKRQTAIAREAENIVRYNK